MNADTNSRPTALVSYSHTELGWSPEQIAERHQNVQRLVYALRTIGAIDADADIFHQNEDWTRWGPAQVAESDFVLVVVSPAWANAWLGQGDPQTSKGLRAEADAVRSIEQGGRPDLQKQIRLILMTGSSETDIPVGMHGITRHRLSGFEQADLEDLIRDLTNQPKFVKPALGEIPIFPPAMTTHTPDVERFEAVIDQRNALQPAPVASPQQTTERIEQLRAQLVALPLPLPGEGPHLPWYRLRQQIESQLAVELRESGVQLSETAPRAEAAPVVEWLPADDVEIVWASDDARPLSGGSSALFVHIVPTPARPLSQRVLASLDEALPRIVRDLGLVGTNDGLEVSSTEEEIVVKPAAIAPHGNNGARMGQLLGLRVNRNGQLSIWISLPRDNMGAVLDKQQLTRDIQTSLSTGAAVLESTYGATVKRVAVAAELTNTISLTGGTLAELGTRSQATMPGAFRTAPRVHPDESIDARHLLGDGAHDVAEAVATILVRAWPQ